MCKKHFKTFYCFRALILSINCICYTVRRLLIWQENIQMPVNSWFGQGQLIFYILIYNLIYYLCGEKSLYSATYVLVITFTTLCSWPSDYPDKMCPVNNCANERARKSQQVHTKKLSEKGRNLSFLLWPGREFEQAACFPAQHATCQELNPGRFLWIKVSFKHIMLFD